MENKYYKKKKISLADQIFKLRAKYNFIDYKITSNMLTLNQKVKPSNLSREYIITIKYDGYVPEIYLYNQGIMQSASDDIPHCYKKYYNDTGFEFVQLCLYYPKLHEWNNDMYLADTIIPWAIEWLYYYELWRITGKWLGGGIDHEKN